MFGYKFINPVSKDAVIPAEIKPDVLRQQQAAIIEKINEGLVRNNYKPGTFETGEMSDGFKVSYQVQLEIPAHSLWIVKFVEQSKRSKSIRCVASINGVLFHLYYSDKCNQCIFPPQVEKLQGNQLLAFINKEQVVMQTEQKPSYLTMLGPYGLKKGIWNENLKVNPKHQLEKVFSASISWQSQNKKDAASYTFADSDLLSGTTQHARINVVAMIADYVVQKENQCDVLLLTMMGEFFKLEVQTPNTVQWKNARKVGWYGLWKNIERSQVQYFNLQIESDELDLNFLKEYITSVQWEKEEVDFFTLYLAGLYNRPIYNPHQSISDGQDIDRFQMHNNGLQYSVTCTPYNVLPDQFRKKQLATMLQSTMYLSAPTELEKKYRYFSQDPFLKGSLEFLRSKKNQHQDPQEQAQDVPLGVLVFHANKVNRMSNIQVEIDQSSKQKKKKFKVVDLRPTQLVQGLEYEDKIFGYDCKGQRLMTAVDVQVLELAQQQIVVKQFQKVWWLVPVDISNKYAAEIQNPKHLEKNTKIQGVCLSRQEKLKADKLPKGILDDADKFKQWLSSLKESKTSLSAVVRLLGGHKILGEFFQPNAYSNLYLPGVKRCMRVNDSFNQNGLLLMSPIRMAVEAVRFLLAKDGKISNAGQGLEIALGQYVAPTIACQIVINQGKRTKKGADYFEQCRQLSNSELKVEGDWHCEYQPVVQQKGEQSKKQAQKEEGKKEEGNKKQKNKERQQNSGNQVDQLEDDGKHKKQKREQEEKLTNMLQESTLINLSELENRETAKTPDKKQKSGSKKKEVVITDDGDDEGDDNAPNDEFE